MMILTRSCSAIRRVVYCTGIILLSTGLPGSAAADDITCSELTVSGLLESDGFPAEDTIYTNTVEGEGIKGIYLSEEGNHTIWYSPSGLNTESSDFQDATENNCVGKWIISSYSFGEDVTEEVWYQATVEPQCESSPAEVDSSYWERVERGGTYTNSESITVSVACAGEGDGGGLSNKDVILVLIAVGVGFMACLCCGALICCIRGKNSNEEAVMPPGELTEGSIIGMKAEELKPGLHAHPEVRGKQHPRPEDWAPSHASSSSIPLGSRSGPSVRSIGYT